MVHVMVTTMAIKATITTTSIKAVAAITLGTTKIRTKPRATVAAIREAESIITIMGAEITMWALVSAALSNSSSKDSKGSLVEITATSGTILTPIKEM